MNIAAASGPFVATSLLVASLPAGCSSAPVDGAPSAEAAPRVTATRIGASPNPIPTPSASGSAAPHTTTRHPAPDLLEPPHAPAPSASAEGPNVPKSKEELEWMNEGCWYRRSTNTISKCEPQPVTRGAWKPTQAEIASALKLDSGLCYCAKPVERPVLTCMESAKAALVTVTIGKSDEPTDCTVVVSSAEIEGRRWVRLLADNRDRSTFYQVERIVEIEAGGAASYYLGFEELTDALVKSGDEGISKRLREDWPKLSVEARHWLTTRI